VLCRAYVHEKAGKWEGKMSGGICPGGKSYTRLTCGEDCPSGHIFLFIFEWPLQQCSATAISMIVTSIFCQWHSTYVYIKQSTNRNTKRIRTKKRQLMLS